LAQKGTKKTYAMSKDQATFLPAERDPSEPVGLTVRFNEKLRQQLADAADRSVRSMNGEIVFRLKTSFEHDALG
jgi:Arc-like DNA binding domain